MRARNVACQFIVFLMISLPILPPGYAAQNGQISVPQENSEKAKETEKAAEQGIAEAEPDLTRERELRVLILRHPDWQEKRNSPDYDIWFGTLPPEKQEAIRTSQDGLFAAQALDEFVAWRKTADISPRNKAQVKNDGIAIAIASGILIVICGLMWVLIGKVRATIQRKSAEQSVSPNEVNLLDCCNREENLRGRETMEKKTKIILGFSLVVALLMLVFAPEKGGGYEFIADIDEGVDVWRLVIQLAAVGCLAGIASFLTASVARIMGFVLGGVVLLAVAVIGAFYFTQEYPKRHVKVVVTYDPVTLCSKEYPLSTQVENRGGATVEKVWFRFAAFEPGRSTNLFGWDDQRTFDVILGPGEIKGLCWRYPKEDVLTKFDPATLLYKAEDQIIHLK